MRKLLCLKFIYMRNVLHGEPFALRPFEYSQSWGAAVLFKECFEKANRQSDIREMGRELSEIHDSFL